jgi:hypothetical protein
MTVRGLLRALEAMRKNVYSTEDSVPHSTSRDRTRGLVPVGSKSDKTKNLCNLFVNVLIP